MKINYNTAGIKELKNFVVHWTDKEGLIAISDDGFLNEYSSLSTTFQLSYDLDNHKPFGILLNRKKVESLGYKKLPLCTTGVTPMELKYELRGTKKIPFMECLEGFVFRNKTNYLKFSRSLVYYLFLNASDILKKCKIINEPVKDMLYNPFSKEEKNFLIKKCSKISESLLLKTIFEQFEYSNVKNFKWYHYTNEESKKSIEKNGFNFSLVKNSLYGKGIYFTNHLKNSSKVEVKLKPHKQYYLKNDFDWQKEFQKLTHKKYNQDIVGKEMKKIGYKSMVFRINFNEWWLLVFDPEIIIILK
jgi:hypothetical protein